jgi:hypothetical protein
MGIRSGLSDAVAGVKTAWNNTVDQIGARINGLFDTAAAQLGSIWSGGFIGIDESNWGEIKTAIEGLIEKANGEVDKFNELANRDDALKGEAATALGEYLKACKNLLYAYVTTYRNFITDAETAMNAMKTGDSENAKSISEAAANVEAMANEIKVN